VSHATSHESLRNLYGAREYACMLKSGPVALAACRSAKTPLVVVLCVVSFVGFLIPVLRLVIIRNVSGFLVLICGHMRRPPMEGLPRQM